MDVKCELPSLPRKSTSSTGRCWPQLVRAAASSKSSAAHRHLHRAMRDEWSGGGPSVAAVHRGARGADEALNTLLNSCGLRRTAYSAQRLAACISGSVMF